MVAASVKIETGMRTIGDESVHRDEPPEQTEIEHNRKCRNFIYAKFYTKYKTLIDGIDTSPFTSIVDIRKNKYDTSILRDPRKIAVQMKYLISGFSWLKDFRPPLEEFVVKYSARPDLETECAHDLDVTGIRN